MAARKGKDFLEHNLSRRERQIMQAVYRLGRGTISEIARLMPNPPTDDAIADAATRKRPLGTDRTTA